MKAEDALRIKKPATEETLQSIDGTLKRIEAILRQGLLQRDPEEGCPYAAQPAKNIEHFRKVGKSAF